MTHFDPSIEWIDNPPFPHFILGNEENSALFAPILNKCAKYGFNVVNEYWGVNGIAENINIKRCYVVTITNKARDKTIWACQSDISQLLKYIKQEFKNARARH